jgi:prepilin-type N-terminal cleavage/methylation domain-containing protein
MRRSHGFSLVELLVVIAVMATMAAIAVPISTGMILRSRADGASNAVFATIQSVRNRAVAERRNVQFTFVPPNRVTAERLEVPGPATTVVEDVFLENDQTFHRFPALPDTPDAFGAASAIRFSGTLPVMFTSEGSLVDADGDVVNGTIFLGRADEPTTARAITFFGVTGVVRLWKWNGAQWVQ